MGWILKLVRDFWKSQEISDYMDYVTITQIRNTLKKKKICVIILWNLYNQESEKHFELSEKMLDNRLENRYLTLKFNRNHRLSS